MPKIRVLVVDDAVVSRRLLSDVLGQDPDLEVVGTAANGRIALAKIRELAPDLVTLDAELPKTDGMEALVEIRKEHPELPVIMFSPLTQRGAAVTLDALGLGAKDYITKPANVGGVEASTNSIRDELIPKIKVFCSRAKTAVPAAKALRWPANGGAASALPSPTLPRPTQRIDLVAIGVSTGGPSALEKLVPALPADFPVAVAIVQHMPPIFTNKLAQRLSALSNITVHQAAAGDILQRGGVWLAPGGYHMSVTRGIAAVQVQIGQSPPENFCRPSVDVLFRSVSELYGPRALAVVLTGMGEDGLRGCEAIHRAGGQVIVQDEASSVVWGMPGRVAMAGLADAVLPLDELAAEIVRRVQFGRL
jgi:two-component system chemotaxis response regulator CheB